MKTYTPQMMQKAEQSYFEKTGRIAVGAYAKSRR